MNKGELEPGKQSGGYLINLKIEGTAAKLIRIIVSYCSNCYSFYGLQSWDSLARSET